MPEERSTRTILENAFSTDTLRASTDMALQALVDYLQDDSLVGVKLVPPNELVVQARELMRTDTSDGGFQPERFRDIIDLYLRTAIHLRSRGYMGRQFSSVLPATGAFEMVLAMAPQPASFYEAGQLANVADKIIADEFGGYLDWAPGTFDMISTSGGALATLTAMLAARNTYAPHSWSMGVANPPGRRLAIAASEDAHYAVTRAAGVLGVGDSSIVLLPLNAQRQIDVIGAIRVLEEAKFQGLDVFCLVASAGTTSVGAIDPLTELAHYARSQGIWFHVDAAHGGAMLVSESLRPRLAGIELADSFCLDAHKTLFVPAACTLLFYRDPLASRRAFVQEASYVFDHPEEEMTLFESGSKNFECTKRPSIMELWMVLSMYGPEVLAAKLEYLVDLTRQAHAFFESQPDFRTITVPEINILCLEYVAPGLPPMALGALQVAIRDRMRVDGRYLITKVDIGYQPVLRVVFMNHELSLDDVEAMASEIRVVAAQIMEGALA
jgi:L-2,4-diaminobutyrate decarboxylase